LKAIFNQVGSEGDDISFRELLQTKTLLMQTTETLPKQALKILEFDMSQQLNVKVKREHDKVELALRPFGSKRVFKTDQHLRVQS
jgi:hypothetical protein